MIGIVISNTDRKVLWASQYFQHPFAKKIAEAVGIYNAIYQPWVFSGTLDIIESPSTMESGLLATKPLIGIRAKVITDALTVAYGKIKMNPERYLTGSGVKEFISELRIDMFIEDLRSYWETCRDHPEGIITVPEKEAHAFVDNIIRRNAISKEWHRLYINRVRS